MRFHLLPLAFTGFAIFTLIAGAAQAQVSYSTFDSTYSQDFDTLPNTPTNVSLGASPLGWTDDNAAPGVGNFSILGWYLYHPIETAEGGFNGHQRLRIGTGSANTGSFWSYGSTASTDRALGDAGSTSVASASQSMLFGLRLKNDTGQAISGFELIYDGEQWRKSGAASGETLSFGYSLTVDNTDWFSSADFSNVATLKYMAPVTGTAGVVDGNVAGLVDEITGVASGFSWLPGEELWLRWSDPGGAAAVNDGMAIDNVRFKANNTIVDPFLVTSVMTGTSSTPATWSNNLPPDAANKYHVLSGHTVTVDAAFAGNELRAFSGGVINFDNGGSGLLVPRIVINAGGDLTVNASGNFFLGDILATTLGTLVLNDDVSFNIDAGADFGLDMILDGAGDIDFNSGAGSRLILTNAANHDGTIRFNGSGDQVRLTEVASSGYGTLEMNSTGANTLFYNPGAGTGAATGIVIFNQAGTVDHAATTNRLQGMSTMVANAAVTVDLSKGYPDDGAPSEERRFLVNNGTDEALQGSGNIIVNGTPTNHSNGTTITLNEFEVGSTGQPGTVVVDSYSGTLSTNNYVNVEIRHHMPNAKFVINDKAVLDMGHQALVSTHSIQFGEIEVNSGGTLDVGFAQQSSTGVAGNHVYNLTLTGDGTRDGDLTINDGATLNMQINRTATDLVFDTIEADGDVKLNGTLNVLVNSLASSGASATTPYGGTYTPTIGDKFDIISINSVSPIGDYNGNTTVGAEDYDVWQAAFDTATAAADGNLDGTVNAADYAIWRDHLGGSGVAGGTIMGEFDLVTFTDFANVMAGFAFKANYTSTLVQLEVIAAPPGSGAVVPEPSTLVLAGVILALLGVKRPRS